MLVPLIRKYEIITDVVVGAPVKVKGIGFDTLKQVKLKFVNTSEAGNIEADPALLPPHIPDIAPVAQYPIK